LFGFNTEDTEEEHGGTEKRSRMEKSTCGATRKFWLQTTDCRLRTLTSLKAGHYMGWRLRGGVLLVSWGRGVAQFDFEVGNGFVVVHGD
jgi:hypothetical protein